MNYLTLGFRVFEVQERAEAYHLVPFHTAKQAAYGDDMKAGDLDFDPLNAAHRAQLVRVDAAPTIIRKDPAHRKQDAEAFIASLEQDERTRAESQLREWLR
jgi:hypothetical protein